jgi:sec-independent protein translocase protein TatA
MFTHPLPDLLVVFVIVLLFFGPKRLPALGRSIGSGIREFKSGLSGSSSESPEPDQPEQLARPSDSAGSGASPSA